MIRKNLSRTRFSSVFQIRFHTSSYTRFNPSRSKQYDWIQSRYSRDNYVPYNPYRGKSYAKNGAVMTFYSKTGHIPLKPFPKDTSKQVSWKSNAVIPKQKVPSHREIKYMRGGDYSEKH